MRPNKKERQNTREHLIMRFRVLIPKYIREHAPKKLTPTEIARRLNKEGLRTITGLTWNSNRFTQFCTNEGLRFEGYSRKVRSDSTKADRVKWTSPTVHKAKRPSRKSVPVETIAILNDKQEFIDQVTEKIPSDLAEAVHTVLGLPLTSNQRIDVLRMLFNNDLGDRE